MELGEHLTRIKIVFKTLKLIFCFIESVHAFFV